MLADTSDIIDRSSGHISSNCPLLLLLRYGRSNELSDAPDRVETFIIDALEPNEATDIPEGANAFLNSLLADLAVELLDIGGGIFDNISSIALSSLSRAIKEASLIGVFITE